MNKSKNRQPVASGEKKRHGYADGYQIWQPVPVRGYLVHHSVYPIDTKHVLQAKQTSQMPRSDHKMQNRSQ